METLETIDWTQPWFQTVASTASAIRDRSDHLAALSARSRDLALANDAGIPLSFVEHAELPAGTAYESFIARTGKVPTRENCHDLFNALVWLSFPHTKRRLNALQAAEIRRHGIGGQRGAVRDAATLFDENGAVLAVDGSPQGNAVVEALRARRWREALHEQRATFTEHVKVFVFGHALMEKLLRPYKSITAHVWVSTLSDGFLSLPAEQQQHALDLQVASELACVMPDFKTACFTPLPVLGIPGWWQPQGPDFYADAEVFRPASHRRKARRD